MASFEKNYTGMHGQHNVKLNKDFRRDLTKFRPYVPVE